MQNNNRLYEPVAASEQRGHASHNFSFSSTARSQMHSNYLSPYGQATGEGVQPAHYAQRPPPSQYPALPPCYDTKFDRLGPLGQQHYGAWSNQYDSYRYLEPLDTIEEERRQQFQQVVNARPDPLAYEMWRGAGSPSSAPSVACSSEDAYTPKKIISTSARLSEQSTAAGENLDDRKSKSTGSAIGSSRTTTSSTVDSFAPYNWVDSGTCPFYDPDGTLRDFSKFRACYGGEGDSEEHVFVYSPHTPVVSSRTSSPKVVSGRVAPLRRKYNMPGSPRRVPWSEATTVSQSEIGSDSQMVPSTRESS